MAKRLISRTDIVTNSSDEVFILRGPLSEVIKYVREKNLAVDTPAYIKSSDDPIIQELIDFGDLYEKNEVTPKYILSLGNSDLSGLDWRRNVQRAWVKFVLEHRTELPKWAARMVSRRKLFWYNRAGKSACLWPDLSEWSNEDVEFFSKFLDWYKATYPGMIPKRWVSLPDYMLPDYWVGAIGFRTLDENSVSWDEMKELDDTFDDFYHWHMG